MAPTLGDPENKLEPPRPGFLSTEGVWDLIVFVFALMVGGAFFGGAIIGWLMH